MKKIKDWTLKDYLYWTAALLPFVISAVFYTRLPERVPTHWGIDNTINGYSSRNMAAWGIPALMFLFAILIQVVFAMDPKRKNIEKSHQMMELSRWSIVLLAIYLQMTVMLAAVGVAVNVGLYTKLIIGILIIAIGNYLPKCRQNYAMGIKIPWTLSDEENWRRTHRMAGRLWMIGGVLMVICAFFDSKISAFIYFAVVMVICLIPYVYSYMIYRQEKKA